MKLAMVDEAIGDEQDSSSFGESIFVPLAHIVLVVVLVFHHLVSRKQFFELYD